MVKYFLLLFLLFQGCAHQEVPEINRAKELLGKMNTAEKYRMLRSYQFLQSLSANPGRMPIPQGYLPGIPRLGIPSIEFVGSGTSTRHLAQEEKILKLGFVNLIRDSAKTQVFGNFEEASTVDSILGPSGSVELKNIVGKGELKDLDLFLVQEGHAHRVRKYVCAQHRDGEDFHCVSARLEGIIKELGIGDEYNLLLSEEKLFPEHLDRLTGEVLSTMDELEII